MVYSKEYSIRHKNIPNIRFWCDGMHVAACYRRFSVRHTRMILGALGIRFFVSSISSNLQTGQSTPRPTLKN
jgi:hypothetical protein